VPEKAWEVLAQIETLLKALPEEIEFPAFIGGIRVGLEIAVTRGIPNCHVIAHALSRFLPVDVHDGFVLVTGSGGKGRRLEHSWFTLHDSNPSIIIDPWPLGVATGPAIFIQDYAYHFGPKCSFLAHKSEEFKSDVETLVAALAAIQENSCSRAA